MIIKRRLGIKNVDRTGSKRAANIKELSTRTGTDFNKGLRVPCKIKPMFIKIQLRSSSHVQQ